MGTHPFRAAATSHSSIPALSNTLTGMFAILITGVAVISLVYRTNKRLFRFGFDSVLIGIVYVVGMYVVLRT